MKKFKKKQNNSNNNKNCEKNLLHIFILAILYVVINIDDDDE